MLGAMALAVHEKGYTGTAVADVVAGAGVSRETFYQHFADKEACFLAAYEVAVGTMRQTMGDALAGRPTDPLARLDRALHAYLDLLASEGAMDRVFLVDVYAAAPGPAAPARGAGGLRRGDRRDLLGPLGRRRFACRRW